MGVGAVILKWGKSSMSKCLIIVYVLFSFFVTKRTQSNSEKGLFDQH